jgi:hypothetical protein
MSFNPKTAQARILLNPQFVSQHAERPLRLAALILHELLHHLLHHYVLYPNDAITNLGQDAIINAMICRLSPSFQQLFTEYYDKHTFPEMLLRPGANLRRIKNNEIREQVTQLYRLLYRKHALHPGTLAYYKSTPSADRDVISVDDLCAALSGIRRTQEALIAANLAAQKPADEGLEGLSPEWWKDSTPLLGDHSPLLDSADPFAGDGLEETHLEDFDKLLDDLTADLGANGNASALFHIAFNIDRERAPDELLKAMEASMREDILRMKQIVEGVIGPRPNLRSIIPRHIGRKEVLLLSSGIFPLFYPAFAPDEKPSGDVIIYLDVSGSMGDQARFLLMLLTAFKEQVAAEFYQFSTIIEPTNFANFVAQYERDGTICMKTTGGTNFDPIFEHAQKQGFKKILLITDGCAGLSDQYAEFAEAIETFTLFTIQHNRDPLSAVSRSTWVMPNILNPQQKATA